MVNKMIKPILLFILLSMLVGKNLDMMNGEFTN